MSQDIVKGLRDWAHIIDNVQGEATLVMLSGDPFIEAADEIERLQAIIRNLRTIGDRLYVHLDAQFGIMNSAPYEIDKSLFLWREFRHDA